MIVNRPVPHGFKTYEIIAPLATHFRPAGCEEVGCAAFTNGWKTRVLPGTPEHAQVLSLAGRYRFTGPERQDDGLDVFTFPAGQQCFRRSQHRVPLEREPIYLERNGAARQFRAEDWIDNFANHQQAIADRRQQG